MTALPNRQHRMHINARDLASRDRKRTEVNVCPVCGHRRRMASVDGSPEPGCSTACNDLLLKERKAKARRAKSLRFLAWKRDVDSLRSIA